MNNTYGQFKRLWKDADLKAYEKLLCIYLLDSKHKTLAVDVIAEELGLNRKTVYKTLTLLEEKNILTRTRQQKNEKNTFSLNL
jgi:predicted transcriptional regulator